MKYCLQCGASAQNEDEKCDECNFGHFTDPTKGFVDPRIATLERRNAALLDFVKQFLGNFKACDYCEGGRLKDDSGCRICHGTGYRIDSIGILYVDLRQAAIIALGAK